jgi:hypothetical protein
MQRFPTLLGRCRPCALVALALLATAVPAQAESPAGDAQVGPL